MSQASQISRYRPAVVAITGAAAAYGIYILYNTYSDQAAKSGLHRSNAVHRGRTRATALPPIEIKPPGRESHTALGSLRFRDYPDFSWFIASQGQPDAALLRESFGLSEDMEAQFQERLNTACVRSILLACFTARDPAMQAQQDRLGITEMREVILSRDVTQLLERKAEILKVLPRMTLEQIDLAIREFCHGSSYYTASDNDDGMTHAETEDVDEASTGNMEPSHGLKGLLYHIAEADAKRKAYEHRGIHCEECGERPIQGIRWHCLNCPDYDLCSTCEADNDHCKTHVFAKIKIPLPVLSQPTRECPLWYPGDPRKMHAPLKPGLKKQLEESYAFDGPQLDAYYDQFTCIANMPWPNDPNEVKAAIDRRAFCKAFTSERWSPHFKKNLLYDRMFDFYDTNKDNLIGFEEFVDGLAYLRGNNRYSPLSRTVRGFDLDGDGCVGREDFLHIFGCKQKVQRWITADMVEGHETENTRRAMDTLRSSQPISSVFSTAELPQGEERTPQQKFLPNGELDPSIDNKTVLEDDEGWAKSHVDPSEDRADGEEEDVPAERHERLDFYLSHFNTLDHEGLEEVGAAFMPGSSPLPFNPRKGKIRYSALDGYETDETETTSSYDVLWPTIEDAYDELLDLLFLKKEEHDRLVYQSAQERQKWRHDIEQIIKEQRRVDRREKRAVMNANQKKAAIKPSIEATDPLVAMAMASSAMTGSFVPTDTASLTSREERIRQQSLNELLSNTGYSTTGEDGTGRTNSLDSDSDTSFRDSSNAGSSEEANDRTLPQNFPDTPPTSQVPSFEQRPPRDVLEKLASLEKDARQIRERGGPGRLTFAEVEEIIDRDATRKLRGMVVSWLEWASF